jgi:hypothetical protein
MKCMIFAYPAIYSILYQSSKNCKCGVPLELKVCIHKLKIGSSNRANELELLCCEYISQLIFVLQSQQ